MDVPIVETAEFRSRPEFVVALPHAKLQYLARVTREEENIPRMHTVAVEDLRSH